jgi:hypothetical protein
MAASLFSFSTGAALIDEIPTEPGQNAETGAREEVAGFTAWGESFFVWDEDARYGRRWAAELAHEPARPSTESPDASARS